MKIAKPNLKWHAMTLRRKTLLIIGATVVGLIAIAFAVSQTILMGSYAGLEKRDTGKNVERAFNTLQEDIAGLATVANDWATWDDTYKFIDDLNEEYINSNLADLAMSGLRVEVMLFVNLSGQVVFGKAFDLDLGQEVTMPESLLQHISINSPLVYYPNEKSSVSGVIILPEGPMLVASEPILPSEGGGPIRGALVMGRYLDSTEVGRLSETVRLSLALQRLDEPEMPDDLKQALTTLSEDTPIFIHPLDKDLVSGYGLIEDIYGEPVLILRVDLPRAIYQQGQTSMIYFMAFMFGASVVVGTVALLLLESLILSPLSRLSSSVSRIGASGDTLARILMTGKDEMSGLANEINGMLETLKQSQEELKRSEKYFRTLIENAHDAMVIIGGDGAIAYGSPSIERMLGYKPMELIGTDGFGFAHPDDMPGVMNDFAEITKGPGATVHTELRIRHKDGSWRIVEAVATNLLENQAISGIVVNWRDVTERRRLEDDLRQSELLATTTVEGMSDGVMLVGMDGKVTYVNRAFEKMLGYSASELVGTSAVELPTYRESKDKKKAREELLKVLEKGKTDSIDMVGVTKDGIEIPISFSASVIKDNQGNPGTLVAVIRDITEHKKAEELLRYSEEYFRTLMENSLDAVTIMNEDGTIRYESPSYERLLGFKPEERVNGNLFERIHPDDIKRVAELFAEFLPDRGDVLHTEVRAQHKDGSWRSIEAMGSNLLDNPIVKGIVVNLRDVTERKRMEEALRESEERFRRLVNQAPDIIFRWSPDKGLEYVSPAVTGITGFTPGDLMADPLIGLELAKLSDSQLAEDYQRAVVERHSMRARELSFVRNDGKPVHLDIRSHAIRNEKGEVVAYEGILRDITERKEMESQLRLSEERYRLVVENAGEAIVVAQDGMLKFFNAKAMGLLGYSREEMASKPFIEFIHPEDRSMVAERYIARLRGEEIPPVYSFRVVDEGGNTRWAEINAVVIIWEGKPATLYFLTDITERREAEEAVRRSEEKLRRYIESSPDAIYINDLKGNFVYGNSAGERLLGYSRREVVGKNLFDLGILLPEHALKAARLLELNAAGKPTGPDEFELIIRDGSRVWVEICTYPIGQGENTEVIGIARDITERKRMEQQLQLAGRLAAVGELAAGVAHELNNPLAAIQGYSQLLVSRNDLDALAKKDIETIYREALRASKITKNLLSFARRHEPEKRYISINETVEKTLELRVHQMKVNNIELVTELQPDLPNTMADFYQLQQVFMNIAVNAEQAMADAHGKGKLIVRTQKVDDMIQISFIDNGPGIAEENLKKIYDPFFTTKDVGKGTGLGLSICYGIVDAHKGRLYAGSKPGEGASFFVELPIIQDGQQGQGG